MDKKANGFKINLVDIKKASERLRPILKITPIFKSDYFSECSQNDVYFKPENLQITGAYKIRGAYNKISQLSEAARGKGLIAASAGNHAQGVAYAASPNGSSATIVMPKPTPPIKIKATQKLGAKVILAGDCYDEAFVFAKELAKKKNLVFIHPFDDWDVIAGQGTIGLEILAELPKAEILIIPVGGGGLVSGIAIAAKEINPQIKIIGVEPKGAAAMFESLKNRKIVELEEINTVADGVAVKKVGELTFQIAKKLVDEIVTVSETEIMQAFLLLMEKHKLVVEPAGGLAAAALLGRKLKFKNKKVVALLSGGNIDLVTVSSLVNNGLVNLGRIFEFSVSLVDKPGQLLKVAEILARENANVIEIKHNQLNDMERFRKVELFITIETTDFEHINQIKQAFKKAGYELKQKN